MGWGGGGGGGGYAVKMSSLGNLTCREQFKFVPVLQIIFGFSGVTIS